MNPTIDLIKNKLAVLQPLRLDVRDDSHLHAGHHEAARHGGSHFHVLVVAAEFASLNRVQRSRRVYDLLSEELASRRIHALALSLFSPEESDT